MASCCCGRGEPTSCLCLKSPRNKYITGTWEEDVFQADLRNCGSSQDPLTLPLFTDLLPYHCVPHCGVYGRSDYHLCLPLVTVVLSDKRLLSPSSFHGLPKQLLECLKREPIEHVDIFFLAHSCPKFEDAMEPSSRELNILFHMWALQGVDASCDNDNHVNMKIGGFSPEGVSEIPDLCEAEELNGLPLGHMGRRILYMHNGQLSPNNAQVILNTEHSLHSLFTLGRLDNQHVVLTFHLIPSTEVMEEQIRDAAKSSDMEGLLECIEQLDQTELKSHFNACKEFISGCTH